MKNEDKFMKNSGGGMRYRNRQGNITSQKQASETVASSFDLQNAMNFNSQTNFQYRTANVSG